MQQVSETYRRLMSGRHWFETSLVIGESGRLLTNIGEILLFGGDAILVDTGGADSGYAETQIFSLSTSNSLFSNEPGIGNCYSGEIDVEMLMPTADVPRMARLVPYVRVTDGNEYSEWIKKGVYFVDTRETTHNDDGLEILTLHGYDAMLKGESDYPSDDSIYPMLDINVVQKIASAMEIGVDSRTVEEMTKGYMINLPTGYSMRETLGYIASMYAGNFIINDNGDLRLISLNSIPLETQYLIDHAGYSITFGEDPNEVVRILVNR